MYMSKDFLDAVKARRSVYAIGGETTLSDEKLTGLVSELILHVPSAFNSQSGRVVLLFGENHKKLWSITEETLRKIVPAAAFGPTKEKIASFAAGHGTVLFFDDTVITDSFAERFPKYKDNFRSWADQANGMLQFSVWTLLEAEGLGASLQHYNPLIDDEVKTQWELPSSWRLIAEMPFGKPAAAPGEKEFVPVGQRLKVF